MCPGCDFRLTTIPRLCRVQLCRLWVGVSCSHELNRQSMSVCCWSLGFPAVMQGTDAALGNLSGTERPISLLQRYCQEALPAEKGQHHSHMSKMDTRCQTRWRNCMCFQDGGIPWKLSETSCKVAPGCLRAESESIESCESVSSTCNFFLKRRIMSTMYHHMYSVCMSTFPHAVWLLQSCANLQAFAHCNLLCLLKTHGSHFANSCLSGSLQMNCTWHRLWDY